MTRRLNGEGTVYRRKDGRYEGAAYVLVSSGGRRRVSVYGKTAAEAAQKLTAIKAQSRRGIPLPNRSWALGAYLDHWLEHGVSIKRRPLTYQRHESVVRLHLKPGLGMYRLDHLTVRRAQEYFDQLYHRGQPVSQIHQVRKVLSAALTYAMRQELVYRNVARLVELPSYRPREAEHWTTEEVKQFLRAAQDDPLYPAFVLLVLYGLRRGEVLGLRWCDVDFDQGVLRIRQQVQRVASQLRQVELKTHASKRDEPLLATARHVLENHQTKQRTFWSMASPDWQEVSNDALVFTTITDKPVEPRNLYRSFKRICKQHRLRTIPIHGIRHTNATTQKNLQVNARDIQAILGHGDVRTTGIYEHVELASKREALEKVEEVFFK